MEKLHSQPEQIDNITEQTPVINSLLLATVEIARELGNKKFAKKIVAALDNQDLPAVWQQMADAQADSFAHKQAKQKIEDQVAPDPLALIDRIVSEAYALHTGKKTAHSKIAVWGLGKLLRIEPEPETPDEIKLPEIIQPLTDYPKVFQKLQEVAVAEKQVNKEHEQVEITLAHKLSPRKSMFEQANRELQKDHTKKDDIVWRRKDTKDVIHDLDSYEGELDDLLQVNVGRDECQRFMNDESRIDSISGFEKIETIVRDKFLRNEPQEKVLALQLEALDAIVQELDMEDSDKNASKVVLTANNIILAATALGLVRVRGFENHTCEEGTNTLDWAEEFARHLRFLVQDNPHRLAHNGADNLVQFAEDGCTLGITGDIKKDEYSLFVVDVRISRPVEDNQDYVTSRNLVTMHHAGCSSGLQPLPISNFVEPAREFSRYAKREMQFEDKATTLFKRLGAFFEGNWEEMPQLEGKDREYAWEKHQESVLKPFLKSAWNHCYMFNRQPSLLREAAGEGTAHEIAIDNAIIEQITELLSELDTKFWKMNDPKATRAELQVMGIYEKDLTYTLRDEAYDELFNFNGSLGDSERFLDRYTRMLSHYVNTIFGSNVQPKDILSKVEIEDITERAKIMDTILQSPRPIG